MKEMPGESRRETLPVLQTNPYYNQEKGTLPANNVPTQNENPFLAPENVTILVENPTISETTSVQGLPISDANPEPSHPKRGKNPNNRILINNIMPTTNVFKLNGNMIN